MMVERHYDDEALITLIESDRAGADVHLTHCASCTEKLDTFRLITEALHEEDVWNTTLHQAPVPETIANLRGFADRMAAEDAAAALILPELLAGPREEWTPRLMAHPEWRTAGVVRGLVGAASLTTPTNPPQGLAIAHLCTEIVDHLTPDSSSAETAAKLRGAAWRERAYALFYAGKFDEVLQATTRADLAFQACIVDEYDRARVAIIRTIALRQKEDLQAAITSAQFSADVFDRFADGTRVVSARLAQAQLALSRDDYKGAINTLRPIELQLRSSQDARNHALVLNTLGTCLWKLGNLEEALFHHETAAIIFDTLGMPTEAARNRWNIALILVVSGRLDEARPRLESLRTTFMDLGMTSEAALVSLDLSELLLARGEFNDVDGICQAAMRSFEAAGLSYTSRALTALAYIREAAQHRIATPQVAKHVRDYIRRLPEDGQLLFAPPPFELPPSNSR